MKYRENCRIGVAEVVHPNLLDAGELAAAYHLPIQVRLAIGEQTISRLQFITLCHIVLQAITKSFR